MLVVASPFGARGIGLKGTSLVGEYQEWFWRSLYPVQCYTEVAWISSSGNILIILIILTMLHEK